MGCNPACANCFFVHRNALPQDLLTNKKGVFINISDNHAYAPSGAGRLVRFDIFFRHAFKQALACLAAKIISLAFMRDLKRRVLRINLHFAHEVNFKYSIRVRRLKYLHIKTAHCCSIRYNSYMFQMLARPRSSRAQYCLSFFPRDWTLTSNLLELKREFTFSLPSAG